MLPDDSPEQTSLVEQTLMTLRPQLNLCYREASKANPKLEADTILAITLDANGHVTDVRPVTKNNVDDAFLGCLRRQIQTAVFVKPPIDAGTVSFNVPFVFRPRPDGGKPRDASHD